MTKRYLTASFLLMAVATICSPTHAQIIDLGTFLVDDDATSGDVAVVIPEGVWTSYELQTDWSAISGGPFSSEAIWALTTGPLSSSPFFFADPGPSLDSLESEDSVTLTWSGYLNAPISSNFFPETIFLSLQTFEGTIAEWANTQLTLGTELAPIPSTNSTFDLIGGGMAMDTISLGPGEVGWYEIRHPGGVLSVTTGFPETNILGVEDPINADTDLGIFNEFGFLVAANDDEDFPNGILTSSVAADLPAATYYAAVTGWNGFFNGGFDATSDNPNSGRVKISASAVPEPSSLALLAASLLGACSLIRRRSR
ncbi:MAG: PEP-CTERM sorting domain-containing protein [Planctomycetales bacterium]|nr:PEP-CTERM sorting domain-containing protein [Planctomycetales bacterium]